MYLLNTNLDNKKIVYFALRKIYGIGTKGADQVCNKVGISKNIRIHQLSNKQIEKITFFINEFFKIGSELHQEKRKNKNRLIQIATYRGFRHTMGLPLRGQRTHTNAKTARKVKN